MKSFVCIGTCCCLLSDHSSSYHLTKVYTLGMCQCHISWVHKKIRLFDPTSGRVRWALYNFDTFQLSLTVNHFLFLLEHQKKVNAEKVVVSGKKRSQKLYRRHSGRPGGMTVETFDQLQQRIPERIIEHAVRGMLPKGRVSMLYYLYCAEFSLCWLT